jgi:hypothetical protein
MNTETMQLTQDSITTPRADIKREDIKLVKQRPGVYWALDTKTGLIVGRTTKQREYSKYGQWQMARRMPDGTIRYEVRTSRMSRLVSIIPQWARGYL